MSSGGLLDQLFELAAAQRGRTPVEIPSGSLRRLRDLSRRVRSMSARLQAPTPPCEPDEPWAR